MNVTAAKWLNQTEDMDWSVKKHGVKRRDMKKSTNWSSLALIKPGLDQAKFLSTLEPVGLSRKGDNKRPDGLTYPTWKNGKCLIWDFTCADTLYKSYVKKASKEVCIAAAGREAKKVEKYSNLSDYHFVPVGIETYDAYAHYSIWNLNVTTSKFHKVNSYLGCSQFLIGPQKRFNVKSNS